MQEDTHLMLNSEKVFTAYSGLTASIVTYLSDGLHVKGYFVAPAEDKAYPGLLYCRGGIGNVGQVSIERLLPLVKRGFAVFAPFYRGFGGDGGRDEFGGRDVLDVYNALEWMSDSPFIQQGPIPMLGFSRGAIMALQASRDCSAAGPVIVWGGVSDLWLTYDERIDLRRMLRRVVGHPMKQEEEYRRRSAVCWADDIRTPVLLLHGSEDEHVSAEHARRLALALEEARKPYELKIFEGLKHHFPHEMNEQAMDYIKEWIFAQQRC